MKTPEFVANFKNYCVSIYGTRTGTAVSYANAIKYLLGYLQADNIDESVILTVKSIEPDLIDKSNAFYRELLNYFAERGQSSYVKKGFLKAAIHILYDFCDSVPIARPATVDNVLLESIDDNQIVASFNSDKLTGSLPTAQTQNHNYNLSRVSGTIREASRKIYSGRKAEKYFISYLKDYLGLVENVDFFDVSNNKNYGYDIRVLTKG